MKEISGWSGLGVVFAVAAVIGGCSDSSSNASTFGGSGKNGRTSSNALRCGDFLTKADVMALGLSGDGYDENETQTEPGLGVVCTLGGALASIFDGSDFTSMVDGYEDAIMSGTIAKSDGPSIGQESHWATFAPEHEVIFLGTSGKHAADVTSTDATTVEAVAKALDAKL